VRRLLLAVLAALTLAALPASADPTDELSRLREDAARLRRSLDDLEARIRALESASSAAPTLVAPSANALEQQLSKSPLFRLHQSWSEIEPGTPQERVDALLGRPERVMRINGDLVWYYVYPGLGRGSVFFNSEGKVTAAQAPRMAW
jgi:hypothetical protein